MFRLLRADEIDVRVSTVSEKGVSLLLFKDARCDQNILDETVGIMNWKKSYQLIDGQLFCTIEIWDDQKKQWIGKQDVGVEGNTEAEKSRASDAQKRSAFAFGIGRELYTAPFIWVPANKCQITTGKNGKPTCYDKFFVEKISYDERNRICELYIANNKTKKNVYSFGEAPKQGTSANNAQWKVLDGLCRQAGINLDGWLTKSNLTRETAPAEWTVEAINAVKHRLENK